MKMVFQMPLMATPFNASYHIHYTLPHNIKHRGEFAVVVVVIGNSSSFSIFFILSFGRGGGGSLESKGGVWCGWSKKNIWPPISQLYICEWIFMLENKRGWL